MDWIWYTLFVILWFIGLIGCFVPVLPGPPIAFIGLLLLQLCDKPLFSTWALIIWAIFIVFITFLDYWFPLYGTKVFGGTKWGSNGALIGMIIGMFVGPIGIFLGAFLGAFIGELLNGKSAPQSLNAALGSFLGFLAGTVVKAITVFLILVYFFIGLIF